MPVKGTCVERKGGEEGGEGVKGAVKASKGKHNEKQRKLSDFSRRKEEECAQRREEVKGKENRATG